MSLTLILIGLVAALAIFGVVLALIKKNKIAEEYSSIWIATSVVIILSVIFSNSILYVYSLIKGADGFGPEILLFGSLVFVVLFLLFVSVKLSSHERAIVRLSQDIAILRQSLEASGVKFRSNSSRDAESP